MVMHAACAVMLAWALQQPGDPECTHFRTHVIKAPRAAHPAMCVALLNACFSGFHTTASTPSRDIGQQHVQLISAKHCAAAPQGGQVGMARGRAKVRVSSALQVLP